jgi:hypothetical protein
VNPEFGHLSKLMMSMTMAASANLAVPVEYAGSEAPMQPTYVVMSTTPVRRNEFAFVLSTGTETLETSRWHSYVETRLAELEFGVYDFTDLIQPTEAVVTRARNVVNGLLQPYVPTPSVVPSEDGAVLFVWNKAGWDLHLEVTEGESSIWARERSSGEILYGPLEDHQKRITALLDEFSQ